MSYIISTLNIINKKKTLSLELEKKNLIILKLQFRHHIHAGQFLEE